MSRFRDRSLISGLLLGLCLLATPLIANAQGKQGQKAAPPAAIETDSAVAKALAAARIKKLGLGREAHPDEVAAWDTDIRPDGVP